MGPTRFQERAIAQKSGGIYTITIRYTYCIAMLFVVVVYYSSLLQTLAIFSEMTQILHTSRMILISSFWLWPVCLFVCMILSILL